MCNRKKLREKLRANRQNKKETDSKQQGVKWEYRKTEGGLMSPQGLYNKTLDGCLNKSFLLFLTSVAMIIFWEHLFV